MITPLKGISVTVIPQCGIYSGADLENNLQFLNHSVRVKLKSTLLPHIQVHSPIYIAKAKVHALK